jgi:hypothetical protein
MAMLRHPVVFARRAQVPMPMLPFPEVWHCTAKQPRPTMLQVAETQPTTTPAVVGVAGVRAAAMLPHLRPEAQAESARRT